jgi:hypothetical protein
MRTLENGNPLLEPDVQLLAYLLCLRFCRRLTAGNVSRAGGPPDATKVIKKAVNTGAFFQYAVWEESERNVLIVCLSSFEELIKHVDGICELVLGGHGRVCSQAFTDQASGISEEICARVGRNGFGELLIRDTQADQAAPQKSDRDGNVEFTLASSSTSAHFAQGISSN